MFGTAKVVAFLSPAYILAASGNLPLLYIVYPFATTHPSNDELAMFIDGGFATASNLTSPIYGAKYFFAIYFNS